MQSAMAASLLFFLGACAFASADEVSSNPLDKVFKLMDDLTAKLKKEGEIEHKAYLEYYSWCDETAFTTGEAIKKGEAQREKLLAKINELKSKIQVHTSEIDKLSASIAQDEEELHNATVIREKEEADFLASEKELMDMIEALGKAVVILEETMKKQGAAALAQINTNDMTSTLQALGTILDGAAFPTADQNKLVAFVQARHSEALAAKDADADADADEDFDGSEQKRPRHGVKTGRSGNIIEVMEDMKAKADTELNDLRKAEVQAKHNYQMVKESLEAQINADKKSMEEEKAARAKAEESKASDVADLDIVYKELRHNRKQLATAHAACMQTAADHEATIKSRSEELKVIAKAKEILQGAMTGAASFVQVSAGLHLGLATHRDLARSEVITMIRHLAQEQHSSALAQLSSRVNAIAKMGAVSGGDPFKKIRGMIKDMISKLKSQAREDAEDKAFCDEQLGKTEIKHDDLEEDVSKLTADFDTATSKVSELKGDISQLESELGKLAKEQAELDKIRGEEKAAYEACKEELEPALEAIRRALVVLKDYYGSAGGSASFIQDASGMEAMMHQPSVPSMHSKSAGVGGGIVDILEIAESDMAKTLAKEESQEADAQGDYEKVTQENKVSKASKQEELKYKGAEVKSLGTRISEYQTDLETTGTEFSAVNQYYAKVKDRCIAKPDSYQERKKRRDAEIRGLKEALDILEKEASFVQQSSKRHGGSRRFRGSALSVDS